MFGKLTSFPVQDDNVLPADEMLPRASESMRSDAARFVEDNLNKEHLLRRPDIETLTQVERVALSTSGLSGAVVVMHAENAKIATVVGDCDGNISGLSASGAIVWTTRSTSNGDADPSRSGGLCEWRDVGRVRRLLMSKDGTYLLVSRYKLNELEIVAPYTGENLATIEGPGWPSQIAVSNTDAIGVTWASDMSVETFAKRVSFYQLPVSLTELRQLVRNLQKKLSAKPR